MKQLTYKFIRLDQQIFQWINRRLHHRFLNFWLYYLTHLGGATFTITVSILTWAFAPLPWSTTGAQAAIALAISHIPVSIVKKLYPRLRPYIAIKETNTFRNPLSDHSFPSGHTTAAFSTAFPFMLAFPEWMPVFLSLSTIVGFSRIYLGLHYPSDVLAGAFIGSSVAYITVALWT
ncbi:phosphatase PAP2 family protein [Paenibacillus crassostreae]|uniref:Phosphoesterase n=1 Tax=Paenibacillus crassostreae TaxID=1763538 RepID=A0A167GH91_9BACL|nr:phosphatase PAP2 family protein [Paenibacillus crassostreae]AOZ92111.1 phosphatase PAP2 family protein [Paenibacillus crassostreae]OAB77572.1 phosphoesterase [Paenibacillus crassostreae]